MDYKKEAEFTVFGNREYKRSKAMQSQQFRDTRTGEIVTSVPISEIKHFAQYERVYEARTMRLRDAYLEKCFPDRKASDVSGFYDLSDGEGVGIDQLTVTHYPAPPAEAPPSEIPTPPAEVLARYGEAVLNILERDNDDSVSNTQTLLEIMLVARDMKLSEKSAPFTRAR